MAALSVAIYMLGAGLMALVWGPLSGNAQQGGRGTTGALSRSRRLSGPTAGMPQVPGCMPQTTMPIDVVYLSNLQLLVITLVHSASSEMHGMMQPASSICGQISRHVQPAAHLHT